MKRFIAFLVVFISILSVKAQKFGNEWISYDQIYYKIPIGKEGVYRLTYDELKKSGFPVDIINPKTIQLWAKGEEIAIYLPGENDNKFDAGDFIMFYGTFNDGKLDTDLYTTPDAQSHTVYSLYQDTLPYFLTWQNGGQGKRWKTYEDFNFSGKQRDSFFMYEAATYFRESWSDGAPFGGGLGQLSEYNTGEGWLSYPYSNGGYTYSISTPYYYSNGPSPVIKFDVFGKNDNVNIAPDGNNQETSIYFGPLNTLVYQKRARGYARFKDSVELPKGALQSTNNYSISSSISGGRMQHAFFKIVYPRMLNLGGASFFRFNYNSSNQFLQFDNYGKNQPFILSLSSNTLISSSLVTGTLRFNLPGQNENEILIFDTTDILPLNGGLISKAEFTNFNFGSTLYDFVILSHQKLDSAVREYKKYRETTEGGNHSVFVGLFPQLYDQYYYGIHHPLAIRNIVNEIITKQSVKPEHLVLIGKGQTYNRITLDYNNRIKEDLVPTYGVPPSDYALTSMLSPGGLEPALATGRIPCRTNEQLMHYLEKVKQHESAPDAIWRKEVLHLAGGANSSENNQFKSYLNNYNNSLTNISFGGRRTLLSKTDPLPTVGTLTDKVQGIVNDGISMVTYFGHGSAQVLEIEIGESYQYKNKGKYPLFYFNGCALGNCFEQYSIPESFLFEPNAGCISWTASTSFGFTGELHSYCNIFHQNLFKNGYGLSIGQNFKRTINQYQQPSNDYNRNNCRQLIYLGDPSIRIYSPEAPDFQVKAGSLKEIKSESILNKQQVSFIVENKGKATNDTLHINVFVQSSSNDTATINDLSLVRLYNTDTAVVNMDKLPFTLAGLVTFRIVLDPGNSIKELLPDGEVNNTFVGNIFFTSDGIKPLFPLKDQIIGTTNVTLQVQTLNVFSDNQQVYFELDTTPLFNSPELLQSPLITGGNIIGHTFSLPPFDSTDFYWRARLNLPQNQGGAWVTSTFRYIYKSPDGWGQGYYSKFKESALDRIILDENNRTFDFGRYASGQYSVVTYGRDATGSTDRYIGIERTTGFVFDKFGYLYDNGLRLMAINPDDEFRFSDQTPFNLKADRKWWGVPGLYGDLYYTIGKETGVYQFNTKIAEQRDSLKAYLNRIPPNYHLFVYSGFEMDVDSWDNGLIDAFAQFGLDKIKFNRNGQPYIGKGQKGLTAGEGVEILPDLENSSVAPEKQKLSYSTKLYPKLSSGEITSPLIGPAKKWSIAYLNYTKKSDDPVYFSIIGVNAEGNSIELISSVENNVIDLSNIDASLYPYLKINIFTSNDSTLQPMQLKDWNVIYEGLPEGTLIPIDNFTLTNDTIAENQNYHFRCAFKNISNVQLDSVLVKVTSTNFISQTTDTIIFRKYKALASKDSFHIAFQIPTLGKQGQNQCLIDVNPERSVAESFFNNNSVIKPFFVSTDVKNPLFDVTFDGIHILNNDIVSPKAEIIIEAKDENKFLFIDDKTQFSLALKTPGIDSFTLIDLTSSNIQFVPANGNNNKAILKYQSNFLKDGIYSLSAQVSDKAGNKSSDKPYLIDFKVVNQSTVSEVYVYPNPFTTSARFVFTLTGNTIPDIFNIYIYSVSGKLVKVIPLAERTNLKIGNNISDYIWDGTDDYGDALANGVYLYKVTVKSAGKDYELNQNKSSLFHQGMGKLYIMR